MRCRSFRATAKRRWKTVCRGLRNSKKFWSRRSNSIRIQQTTCRKAGRFVIARSVPVFYTGRAAAAIVCRIIICRILRVSLRRMSQSHCRACVGRDCGDARVRVRSQDRFAAIGRVDVSISVSDGEIAPYTACCAAQRRTCLDCIAALGRAYCAATSSRCASQFDRGTRGRARRAKSFFCGADTPRRNGAPRRPDGWSVRR